MCFYRILEALDVGHSGKRENEAPKKNRVKMNK